MLNLANALVYTPNGFIQADAAVSCGSLAFSKNEAEGQVFSKGQVLPNGQEVSKGQVLSDCIVMPGLADVHVHLREPGYFYKETISSGTLAAAAGGYTAVMSMPNLSPVPDSVENLKVQLSAIERDARVKVYPYASMTKGEKGEQISNLEDLAPYVLAYSDDGRGVVDDQITEQVFSRCKKLDRVVAAHCEYLSLIPKGGCVHDGRFARANGLVGIPSESEWRMVERDLKLAKKTGVKYHVCHVSTKESIELIRQAKKEGVDVTCETAPHYLTMTDGDLKDEGNYKMNPPIRAKEDREELIRGILDGTVDMIATDHAPHSAEEKSKGLSGSLFGVVGLETAFPVMYTEFVKTGIITLEKLVELMSINPCKRFNIKNDFDKNFTVFAVGESYKIDPSTFKTAGRATPFIGKEVYGKCITTICNGERVWNLEM